MTPTISEFHILYLKSILFINLLTLKELYRKIYYTSRACYVTIAHIFQYVAIFKFGFLFILFANHIYQHRKH